MVENSHILTVQEDPDTGDFFIQFPQSVLDRLGWKEGDTLDWTDNKNGSWSLSKREKNNEQN
jgi:bifunctional DNA-binding transcriptional regulator/antitoxin component of YhaV-PrlF toxin-antitoxin module